MQLTLWPSGVLYAEHVLHARQKEFYEEVLRRMKPDSEPYVGNQDEYIDPLCQKFLSAHQELNEPSRRIPKQ